MKHRLKMRPATHLLVPIALLTLVTTIAGRSQDGNPAAGAPAAVSGFGGAGVRSGALPAVDPATGLPWGEPANQWKEPKWKDPDKVLAEVVYEGVPLGEVARDLRKKFNEAFDILIPRSAPFSSNPGAAGDPSSIEVRIQLKNVTASEVFNAMNLVFETENAAMRWELKMNGSRPTVVLRAMMPGFGSPPPEPPRRKIYSVGEMLGEGMTMEQLVKTITEVYQMSYSNSRDSIANHLQFHKKAQLIIATGTLDEVNFVGDILNALRPTFHEQPRATTGGGGGSSGGQKAESKATIEKNNAP